ncbi:MAG TPA: alkaline phosphatase [Thermoleophilia bacterium]|nr:alkaline phosphatase [Thermoleophilia bacterium]
MKRERGPVALTLVVVVLLVVALTLGVAAKVGAVAPADPQPAKNVIVFIGDGMGPEHTELGSLVYGPMAIETLAWDASGWLDTSSLSGVTWSCAAGTALATGYETYNGWVGMSPDDYGDPVVRENALEAAEDLGKASGLVTDVYIQDATPAAFSAHVPDRYLKDGPGGIVAQQLAQDIEVLFGAHAGRLDAYLDQPGVTYSTSLKDLQPYLAGREEWPEKLWGFYGKNSMVYDIDREEEGVVKKQPTLPQMTRAALEVLEQDEDGFFLMVEGGAIDWVSHYRDAAATALEVREFNEALELAYRWAESHPGTLLIVTADHETGGLAVGPDADARALLEQSASTEWMWGLIKSGAMTIRKTLGAYAGFDPTAAEVAHIELYGEHGISDVLAARADIGWGWSGRDEGDHTDTPVPVRAVGPGAEFFAGGSEAAPVPNETVGQALLRILQ